MSSLSHHGIKGQRWGVRRYQNKDGTRTAAGKKHVSDTMLRKRNLIEAGRASLDQKLSTNGGTYINDVSGLSGKGSGTLSNVNKHTAKLSKGSVLNRFATKDEPLDSHRKYVSFTEKDKATYEQTIKGHGLQAKWDSLDDLMHYSYEATKDIKIANGRRIESYITDDLKAKSDYKTNWTSKSIVKAISHHIDNAYIVEGYFNEKANGDWAKKTPEDRKADYKIVSNAMAENGMYSDTMKYYMTGHGTKTFDKMSSALRKEGYDAIVDMFDARSLNQVEHYNGGLADYPMVVLDPKSSLRLKETRKLKHTSIGGTMYIEGNALILGDSSYLEHHGIRGQKWGVRRFQNKDGTLTREGQIRFAKKNLKHAKVRNLDKWGKSPDSNVLYIIGTSGSGKSTTAKGLADDGDQVIHLDTIFEKENRGSPDSNKDFEEFLKTNNVDISKTSDFSIPIEERWKTYDAIGDLVEAYGQHCFSKGSKVVIEGVQMGDQSLYPDKNYFNGKPTVVLKGNIVRDTFRADRRDGVPLRKTVVRLTDKERWNWYKQVNATSNEIKYTSIGGTMYIEGNALILGDSSYLEHHGIKGQRWGIRRFQNRDGSLTNAGRKRLGYATKSAVQTVGKAFKAGVKAGGKAVKAAKAHHEKKEAEKLQKKKEKASKTRLGVMANKDLFTNEEIRKLNERFKLEDEMKMATLQKGVEIAKAVGTIAQNVGTVAKTYEDVTGQSLSPIKRKAAEEKARQDKEDRERRIAREDADEARKAAKEERDIAIHEQTLRKAIAAADTQEFTAQKTKAEADSSVLDAIKKGQDFNGGSDATGQSWMEKAKSGGKNPFDDMIANRDPEYAQIRKEHDEKVARKERMAELERREKEREAEKAAASRQNAPQQKQGGGGDDALFSQKGSLPLDKDRYRNNRAMEKAKQVKEDAAEERAKKQDEKAAKATIDDMMEARRQFTESARANSNGAFDRETAANYIKGKAKELPSKLNPVNAIAKKITNKALKEEETNARKALEDEYKKASRSQGRDEANYTMYYNRVNALQAQGYSERQAKKVADTENPFSSKRNRRFEYNEKVGEIETTHRKNAKEINKANKELTDYYYKLVNGPGYEPGSPKREALDQKYAQKRGELERLEKDNNEMLDREKKKAKNILEHSFSIQNGVLFIDSSDGFAHHGVKGQRWGVRRFQNEDGSLTDKGRKHYEKALAKEKRKQASSDAIRGTLERQHPFAVTGAAVLGAVAAGMSIAATGGASVAMIAAGSAISAAVSSGLTHASYSASEAWEGRGTRIRKKKIAKYENMLKQSDMEEGMYHVENGTLFINAGEPYLEHHGVLGMKWGKHLRAGKGPADAPASAGGGGGEDDEKLKEMAKKAGMSVAEYKQKFASKIGGAASKVGEKVYDAAGGSHKKNAEGWRKMAQEESNAARASERSSHENSARAASQDRKYGSGGDVYRRAADSDKENAKTHHSNAKARSERAASEQAAYEKSLAGKYDKMKADRARKKSARQEKAFSGTSPKEKKRVARKDQYLALPEQKKNRRAYDNKAAETRRARAERLTRDSEIFNRTAEELKRKQNSALNKGNKQEAERKGKDAQFAQDWAEEGRRGAKDWRTGRRTGKPVLRTDSLDQVKKQHDKTLSGKLDKARHTIQRGKQKVYNAAGGKYKDAWQRKTVQYGNDLTRMRRAEAKGDHWNASAAGSMFNLHSQEANRLYNKYDDSLAGRYDEFKEKRKKKKAKHFDDTNAIYTEGTRLVVNSKWG